MCALVAWSGQDDGVADNALVGQAVDELYSLDPDGFVDRRRELAAEARRGGDTAAATEIAGLRKPTRSAWTMNVLARAEPDAFEPIVDVGDQLREAERALDGQRMRELSNRRRELIADISRRAFAVTGAARRGHRHADRGVRRPRPGRPAAVGHAAACCAVGQLRIRDSSGS